MSTISPILFYTLMVISPADNKLEERTFVFPTVTDCARFMDVVGPSPHGKMVVGCFGEEPKQGLYVVGSYPTMPLVRDIVFVLNGPDPLDPKLSCSDWMRTFELTGAIAHRCIWVEDWK